MQSQATVVGEGGQGIKISSFPEEKGLLFGKTLAFPGLFNRCLQLSDSEYCRLSNQSGLNDHHKEHKEHKGFFFLCELRVLGGY